MKCLFCDDELIVDATLSMSTSISKYCGFSYSWLELHMQYYVCVNRKIAIVSHDWLYTIKAEFFAKGTFISFKAHKHKEFDFDYSSFLKEGFVF